MRAPRSDNESDPLHLRSIARAAQRPHAVLVGCAPRRRPACRVAGTSSDRGTSLSFSSSVSLQVPVSHSARTPSLSAVLQGAVQPVGSRPDRLSRSRGSCRAYRLWRPDRLALEYKPGDTLGSPDRARTSLLGLALWEYKPDDTIGSPGRTRSSLWAWHSGSTTWRYSRVARPSSVQPMGLALWQYKPGDTLGSPGRARCSLWAWGSGSTSLATLSGRQTELGPAYGAARPDRLGKGSLIRLGEMQAAARLHGGRHPYTAAGEMQAAKLHGGRPPQDRDADSRRCRQQRGKETRRISYTAAGILTQALSAGSTSPCSAGAP
jgi:hypothetical protein